MVVVEAVDVEALAVELVVCTGRKADPVLGVN